MSEQQPNRKLIAIFVIPLALVSVGLVASKKYIDVFGSQDELKKKVARAQKIGLPFTAQELRASFTSHPRVTLGEDVDISKASEEVSQELRAPKKLSSPKINDDLASQFKYAALAAQSTTFLDARDFDSYDYVDVYSGPRQACKLIVYKARHQATHDDLNGAIDTLKLIPNLFKQMKEDPHIMGLLVNVSMQVEMCRGIAEVSAAAKRDRKAQQRLLDLVNEDWATQSLKHALKGEFYMQLRALRNELPQVLESNLPLLSGPEMSKLDSSRPPQKIGLPPSTVAQGLLSRLLDYYLEVYKVLTSRSDPADTQLLLEAIADDFAEPSTANRFVGSIADNASAALAVYPRQASWKAITRWVIEIHRDYGGKFPATLPTRDDPGLGGQLQYRRTVQGFKVYCTGEDETDSSADRPANSPIGRDDFGIEFPRAVPKD